MAMRRTLSHAELEIVRRKLEETVEPVASIAASVPCDRTTIYVWARRYNWRMRRDQPPIDLVPAELIAQVGPSDEDVAGPDQPSSVPISADDGPASFDRSSVVDRLERAVEDEISAVERLIAQLRAGRGRLIETERAARTLASLVRTLKEISGLRGADNADAEQDDIPRDIDELRRVLASRLDRLEREEGIAGGDAGDDGAGGPLRA